MLNKEKYAKEIVEAVVNSGGGSAGLKGMKPFMCRDMKCEECDLAGHERGCRETFVEWANSEYTEPTVDWSKVPVNTPILVRDNDEEEWKRRYFAKCVNGRVYAYHAGRTSWSAYGEKDMINWVYAKLAESEGD